MEVYKVVRKDTDGVLRSAMPRCIGVRRCAQLVYAKDRLTTPKFGKIFAFYDSHCAHKFARGCFNSGELEVWSAEVPDATPVDIVPSDCRRSILTRFKKFWLDPEAYTFDWNFTMTAPSGTVLCSELTLIRRM